MLALSLSSTAFAPASMVPAMRVAPRADVAMMAKSTALPFAEQPAKLDGSMAGDVGFDPLGLTELGIPLAWMREAEIKHGRVCMLGVVGWILVDQGLRAPGAENAPASFAAHDFAVENGRMWVLLMGCLVLEIAGAGALAASLNGTREPGDFALTGGQGKTPEAMARLKLAEIKHCRLGMMAFSGIATQQALTHGEVGFPYF